MGQSMGNLPLVLFLCPLSQFTLPPFQFSVVYLEAESQHSTGPAQAGDKA